MRCKVYIYRNNETTKTEQLKLILKKKTETFWNHKLKTHHQDGFTAIKSLMMFKSQSVTVIFHSESCINTYFTHSQNPLNSETAQTP